LLTLFAASATLAAEHLIYALALVAQCAFYLLAGYGAWLDAASRRAPVPPQTESPRAGWRRLDAGRGTVDA
jgi:hypothetical protein